MAHRPSRRESRRSRSGEYSVVPFGTMRWPMSCALWCRSSARSSPERDAQLYHLPSQSSAVPILKELVHNAGSAAGGERVTLYMSSLSQTKVCPAPERRGVPHLHRDSAHRCHICTGTRLTAATSAHPRTGWMRTHSGCWDCVWADRSDRNLDLPLRTQYSAQPESAAMLYSASCSLRVVTSCTLCVGIFHVARCTLCIAYYVFYVACCMPQVACCTLPFAFRRRVPAFQRPLRLL